MSGRSCTKGVLVKLASSKSSTSGFNSWSIVSASDYSLSVPIYSILDTLSISFYVIGNADITNCHDFALYLLLLSPAYQCLAASLFLYACTCT